ncbi:AhpC/TSA family protein [Inquilinus sp. KBS0705]|nr:AhpC/TSA family protein [Inquilinus sp. KBS0705]
MKQVFLCILMMLPLMVLAQQPFKITVSGDAYKNGDKIYLVYKAGDKVITDTTIVANNIIEFNGSITGLAKATIYKNEDPRVIEVSHDAISLYIEPGNILIKHNNNPYLIKLSGTPNNNDFNELDNLLRPFYSQRTDVESKYEALTPEQQNDINNKAVLMAALKNIFNQMSTVQLAFVSRHPGSYISLVTLRQIVDNADLLPQIDAAYTRLTPTLKQSPLGADMARIIAAAKASAAGLAAKDFTLPDAKGRLVKLSDFKGKYVLVDFWASWCIPCRAENPNVMMAYQQYKDKGFTVLSVSIEDADEKANWLKAVKADRLVWTQVLDGKPEKEKVKTLYGVTTIPANFLIDPSGKIIAKDLRDKVLLNKLDELLGKH